MYVCAAHDHVRLRCILCMCIHVLLAIHYTVTYIKCMCVCSHIYHTICDGCFVWCVLLLASEEGGDKIES